MGVSDALVVMAVKDCKISLLTLDDNTGVTYSAPVDVPGIKELGLEYQIEEKELEGDGVTLATSHTLKSLSVSFSNAQISLDLISKINGGTLTTTGEEGSEVKKIEITSDDLSNYFLIEGSVSDVEGAGDFHIQAYKVRGVLKINFVENDFATCSFSGKGVARTYDKAFGSITANETAAAIAQVTVA